jgi:O-antigen/teichoic acid export membrane protein
VVADADAADSTSIWRRIRRDVALLGAGNVAIVIAQLGFRSILIAALLPATYGRLSLILSIYNTAWIIGASGLPNSVARYLAISDPDQDSAILRSAVRAGAWPTVVATALVATVSGLLLNSLLAALLAAIGLSSLVYTLLTMGILRGRERMGYAAAIMPIAAVGEVAPLAIVWFCGVGVSLLSAFAIFCMGNVIGLAAGVFFIIRTRPRPTTAAASTGLSRRATPSSRQMLGFSLWLAAATVGVSVLPLIIRSAAALDSYAVVAVIDVAIVLLSIPQRLGSVIVLAVIPHASRAVGDGARAVGQGAISLTISLRQNLLVSAPFVVAAVIVAFTPIMGWLFDALGRPEYAKSADYFAMALLAGPARILYGLVQGMLIAHGEGRFLAITALSITTVASGIIFAAAVLGSTIAAFAVFVAAFWMIYLVGLARIRHLTRAHSPAMVDAPAV